MSTNPQSRWSLRLSTLGVWGLAAASVAYWALKVGGAAAGPTVPVVSSAAAAPVDSARIARLLGAVDSQTAATPVASAGSRFSLIGVVAGVSRTGTALIAIDGKPAKPYRVGATVDTGYVLQSVGPRAAVLAASLDAPAALTLEMAQRPGSSAPAAASGAPGSQAPTRFNAPPAPQMPVLVPPIAGQPPASSSTPGNAPATVPNAPGMSPASSLGGGILRRRPQSSPLQAPQALQAAQTAQIPAEQ